MSDGVPDIAERLICKRFFLFLARLASNEVREWIVRDTRAGLISSILISFTACQWYIVIYEF